MLYSLFSLILVAYLPGALVFRLPTFERERRERLAAEERVFWAIIISIAISSTVALALAWLEFYRFERLLLINGFLSGVIVALVRQGLRFEGSARLPNGTALAPIALICLGIWLYFPPAEYLMGGKDPGVYMNEGLQIAQSGSLVITDSLLASLPSESRDLFISEQPKSGTQAAHTGLRFMGYFVTDPDSGTVVGQFPHLYPIWIAIGYGLDSIDGARAVVGVWAILGVLTLYFLGARLVGTIPALTGALLLSIHVIQIWYSRYPNSELVLQTMLLAGLLAFARAYVDELEFFGPVAATLLGLSMFVRFPAVLCLIAVVGAMLISTADDRRPRASFLAPFVMWQMVAGLYFFTILKPYVALPIEFIKNLTPSHIGLLILGLLVTIFLCASIQYKSVKIRVHSWLPTILGLVVCCGAIYAYFFRTPGGLLAPHDAFALRTYALYYLNPYGLVAALLGLVIVMRRSFWQAPALLLATIIVAFFYFYKVRIVPEHFWMARRFLPIILPMSLLFIGVVAFSGTHRPFPRERQARLRYLARFAIGLTFVALLGRQYVTASGQIMNHVEYEGLIPRLEQIAETFTPEDLVIVESRAASDLHVLALPLAYTYEKNVLVLSTPQPDELTFQEFVKWGHTHYQDIYFLGGGGTRLPVNTIAVEPILSDRFQIPEYESSLNKYPTEVRFKEFDFGLYKFVPVTRERQPFVLDVGWMDDLQVVQFYAKERLSEDLTFRWSSKQSSVSIVNAPPSSHQVTVWASDGGRPASEEPAYIAVSINDVKLGHALVTTGFLPYTFAIPPNVAEDLGKATTQIPLLIEGNTWNPSKTLSTTDDRELGVMIDRVEIR